MVAFLGGTSAAMNVIKLDRTRPFAVTAGGEKGLQYHQDGFDYDSEYCRYVDSESPAEVVESEAPKKRGRPRKE